MQYHSAAPAGLPAGRVHRTGGVSRRPGSGCQDVPACRGIAADSRATRVEERPGRNWKKTALVIGGSTATGAGIGALIGGKKGALIGAAIGGGASTIYE